MTELNLSFVEHENQITARSQYYIYDIDKKDFTITYWAGPDEMFLSTATSLENAKSIVIEHVKLIILNKETESDFNKRLNILLNRHRINFEKLIDKYR